MRTYRLVLALVLLALVLTGAYTAFMYVYTEQKFTLPKLLTEPSDYTVGTPAKQILFLHQVNTPRRAKKKEDKYSGFELDLMAVPEKNDKKIYVAHDEKQLKKHIKPDDIFSALRAPAEKYWWLDLKTDLTQTDIDYILHTAKSYHIPTDHLYWETQPGPTARLIKKNKLNLLLQLPEGFENDEQSSAKRNAINEAALKEWQEYKPAAVSASFGKYTYLKAYFPHLPKAIYYSATIRPSLKKTFMKRHMAEDHSVQIFMLDEYTF